MTDGWIIHDEHPFAEIRDSETGEVIFPARKGPFVLIEGGKPTTAAPDKLGGDDRAAGVNPNPESN